jgi:hypothetical protein
VKKNKDFRSGFEKKIAKFLLNKAEFEYEPFSIPYQVPIKKKRYTPDFVLANGVIVEAKGKLDRETREKMLLVTQQNPDKDIRLLLMRDNKISKTSKTRYSDWCEKNNIKYAVSEQGHVPEEWMKEKKDL